MHLWWTKCALARKGVWFSDPEHELHAYLCVMSYRMGLVRSGGPPSLLKSLWQKHGWKSDVLEFGPCPCTFVDRAAQLAAEIGSYHINFGIDVVVSDCNCQLGSASTGVFARMYILLHQCVSYVPVPCITPCVTRLRIMLCYAMAAAQPAPSYAHSLSH